MNGSGINDIVRTIRSFRIRLSSESQAQSDIEEAMRRGGIPFEAQKRLTARDRPDLFCDGVAVEIKVKGSRTQIWRQLERYAALPDVSGVVLVAGVAWPFSESEIFGKPFRAVSLSLAWL